MEAPQRQKDEFIGQKMLSKRKSEMSPNSLKEGKLQSYLISDCFLCRWLIKVDEA